MAARRVRAYIGLGANVGDPEATLAEAVTALASLPGAHLRGVSRLYVTAPWGEPDQPDFRNAVVAIDVPGGQEPAAAALALLARLKDVERDFGRREGRRWGPRELDLDLLVFGRARLTVERPPEARSVDADGDPARAARLPRGPASRCRAAAVRARAAGRPRARARAARMGRDGGDRATPTGRDRRPRRGAGGRDVGPGGGTVAPGPESLTAYDWETTRKPMCSSP